MSMFENAVRNKYRFPSGRGILTTEQLYDLNLHELDAVHSTLVNELPTADSLLDDVTDPTIQERIDIVRKVFTTLRDEKKERANAAKAAQQKQFLLGILQQKEQEQYTNMDADELRALIADM